MERENLLLQKNCLLILLIDKTFVGALTRCNANMLVFERDTPNKTNVAMALLALNQQANENEDDFVRIES